MNAARLARRWQEAAGDPARMAEALVDEINDPATGLVTRDFLRAELAQVRQEMTTLRGELREEMAALRSELRQEIGQLRHDMMQMDNRTTSLLAQLRQEIAQLESRLMWRMLTMFGVQIALVGILVTILFQILR